MGKITKRKKYSGKWFTKFRMRGMSKSLASSVSKRMKKRGNYIRLFKDKSSQYHIYTRKK